MLKFKSRLTAAAALALTCLANAPAMAHVTYVSGKGTDAGNCSSPANPCRRFAPKIGRPYKIRAKPLSSAL